MSASTIVFEESDGDAVGGFAHDENVERRPDRRELGGREVGIALDRPGDQGGEVERVIQVGEGSDRLGDLVVVHLDDEVHHAEEDVGEADGGVGEVEEGGFGQEGVLLQPDESGNDSGNDDPAGGAGMGPLHESQAEKSRSEKDSQRDERSRVARKRREETEIGDKQDCCAPGQAGVGVVDQGREQGESEKCKGCGGHLSCSLEPCGVRRFQAAQRRRKALGCCSRPACRPAER